MFPFFTTGVIDTGGQFATVINNSSTATSVVDTGGAPWLSKISKNFQNEPYVIFRDLWEDDSWKKP